MFMNSFLGLYLFLSLFNIISYYFYIGKKIETTFITNVITLIGNIALIYSVYWIYINNIVGQNYSIIVPIVLAWIVFECICGEIVTILDFKKHEINVTKQRFYIFGTFSTISSIGIIALYFIM